MQGWENKVQLCKFRKSVTILTVIKVTNYKKNVYNFKFFLEIQKFLLFKTNSSYIYNLEQGIQLTDS